MAHVKSGKLLGPHWRTKLNNQKQFEVKQDSALLSSFVRGRSVNQQPSLERNFKEGSETMSEAKDLFYAGTQSFLGNRNDTPETMMINSQDIVRTIGYSPKPIDLGRNDQGL